LEEGIETTFQEEQLVYKKGNLRIRKVFPRQNLKKPQVFLIAIDYEDDQFAGLAKLKENELNKRCKSLGIDVKKSGRGVTNKSKREELRTKANEAEIGMVERELPIATKDNLWKIISSRYPQFELFETDTRLGVGETSFQSQFRPIVTAATEQADVVNTKDAFTEAIAQSLQIEVDKIFERLQRYTDAFSGLAVKPQFSWDKAVTFEILGKDQHDIEKSLDRRGSGMRRLLMVAFFQYLAEKGLGDQNDYIFAIEEPENCLHPGLQRELVGSFRKLAEEGYQIILTTHSPVFTGASPKEDLALVVRSGGVAKAIQVPDLDLSHVARELGVEPADQITGYNACVYVEGVYDIFFMNTIATKLKKAGHWDSDFEDKNIGFVLYGGDCLKHWIDLRAMKNLNRRFGVIVDSDLKNEKHNIPERKLNWKKSCEDDGGLFFILRKREIENYLHPEAIKRSGLSSADYDDFTDMKTTFGEKVYKVVELMSADEILEMDRYEKDGAEHHELKEIIEAFLALADT